MICTFAGHREVFGFNQSQLLEILESILKSEQGGADEKLDL